MLQGTEPQRLQSAPSALQPRWLDKGNLLLSLPRTWAAMVLQPQTLQRLLQPLPLLTQDSLRRRGLPRVRRRRRPAKPHRSLQVPLVLLVDKATVAAVAWLVRSRVLVGAAVQVLQHRAARRRSQLFKKVAMDPQVHPQVSLQSQSRLRPRPRAVALDLAALKAQVPPTDHKDRREQHLGPATLTVLRPSSLC